jgi:DNA-binding NarL/FixJ family response regulator
VTSVLLADDHALVRAGIRRLLAEMADVEVVGEASDGHETLKLVATLSPNVVLLDVSLPGLNGLEVAARLARERPDVKVMILSMHANEEFVLEALRAGVVAYLLKDSTVAELEIALRAVVRGQTFLSPAVSKRLVFDYLEQAQPAAAILLTPRQREVLQLIAEGHSTKSIAERLGVSVKTAETHRAQLMDRLGIHDIPGLVRFAIRKGVVSSEL